MNNNETVMEYQENISFADKIQKQYLEALKKGFKGTQQEYLIVRDYT